MVLINYAGREINAKIVYYGPGLSGKTTNLECIYASVPTNSRGKMVSMKTRQDRTLFFDFLPLELGEVHGFRTRFLLYTVPGQVFYNATRKLVLKGADAVVFVADSGLGKMDENRESLQNLEENLRELGLSLETIPWVLQYNKRDLPQVYSIDELERGLNPRRTPSFEAAAASGQGVYETLHAVSRLLFQRLVNELRPASGGRATAVAPAAALPMAGSAMRGQAPVTRPLAPAPSSHAPVSQPAPAPGRVPVGRPADIAALRSQPGAQAYYPAAEPTATMVAPPRVAPASPAIYDVESSITEPSPFFGTPTLRQSQPLQENEPEADAAPGEYTTYGHIVDLSVEPEPEAVQPNPSGFIKDPLRRADKSAPVLGVATAPIRTQHVTVSISRAELKQGGTIRVVLDLHVEN